MTNNERKENRERLINILRNELKDLHKYMIEAYDANVKYDHDEMDFETFKTIVTREYRQKNFIKEIRKTLIEYWGYDETEVIVMMSEADAVSF